LRRSSRTLGLASFVLLLAAGCMGPGPKLSPSVVGCYSVDAREYTSVHAAITGFRALPRIIALDTAYGGRVLVPKAWRAADPPNINSAQLTLESLPWRVIGDYIVFDQYSGPHQLGADSVIVTLRGWGGSMAMFLAREDDGFSGLGAFQPLMKPEDAPAISIRLRPAACPNDLA
jgi:hypothetical protein